MGLPLQRKREKGEARRKEKKAKKRKEKRKRIPLLLYNTQKPRGKLERKPSLHQIATARELGLISKGAVDSSFLMVPR